MRTILRFLVIISISGIILFVIGNVYNLSLKKNLILIFWSFLFELQVFIFTCKQTKEILTRQEWFKQIVLFFKSTIMVPVLIILMIVKEILENKSDLLIYLYFHILILYYALGMILTLGCVISPRNSLFAKFKKIK